MHLLAQIATRVVIVLFVQSKWNTLSLFLLVPDLGQNRNPLSSQFKVLSGLSKRL